MPVSVYTRRQQGLALLLTILVTFGAAAIGSVGSLNAPQFYRELSLPSWAPPGWLFGPVWTLLYSMMAVAAWLVWRSAALHSTSRALQLYMLQLGLNAVWSWLFFVWYLGAAAFSKLCCYGWRLSPRCEAFINIAVWLSGYCSLIYSG